MEKERGFTLIELIIVIAIIGVLAAIAIPQFSAYRVRAFDAAAAADLKSVAVSQEAYYVDWETYADNKAILMTDYNLYLSKDVEILDTDFTADGTSYHAESYHPNGKTVYVIDGPGGVIEAKP